VDPRVRAFVHRFDEAARDRAREADEARARGHSWGPLHGLPVTLKENIDTEGVASTLGLAKRQGRPASTDAVVARLAREAGAIVLGKTNVPQTLLSPMETTNTIWGTSSNPWALDHGTGGSSGGEAAAIASGMSPLGLGTDIGGSIRIPSAFCGLCGIKPTVNRWSNAGVNTALPGQEVVRSQVGPMARTTADLGLVLRAMGPPDHARLDPRVAPLPMGDPEGVDLRGTRIGVYEDDGFFTPAASVKRAVREAARTLESRGADIIPFPPTRAEEITYLYFAALSADGGSTLDEWLEGEPVIAPLKLLRWIGKLPDPARRALSGALGASGERRLSKLLGSLGRKPVETLWSLASRRTALQLEEFEQWNRRGLDAVVCPAHVTPAAPHGMGHDFTIGFCYAARYNMLDMPAGVVPVTRVQPGETERPILGDRLDRRAAGIEARSEGLPVGVQIVGRPWREHDVLAVMQAVESGARHGKAFPTLPVDAPAR
jgi:fatty acid amide hydrolase